MKSYRIVPGFPASELFLDSLIGVGSPDLECGFCGRMHYCPNYYNRQDDLLSQDDFAKQVLSEHTKDPDGVILHYDYDFNFGKELNGIVFVVDCPCNGLRLYEDFIWNNHNEISEFITERKTIRSLVVWM